MTESRAKPRAKDMSRASKPRTARALGDSTTASKIRFSATLFRPVATAKAVAWTFLILPKEASVKLPSRGMTSVEGTFNGLAFRATLQPDGQGGHWLKVDRKLREVAGAEAGNVVSLEIAPVAEEPEPRVPAALRKALAAAYPTRAPMPGELLSQFPATLSTWMFWAAIHSATSDGYTAAPSIGTIRYGLRNSRQSVSVRCPPGELVSPNQTVPSESITFRPVRSE
jgi:hypothetical protein